MHRTGNSIYNVVPGWAIIGDNENCNLAYIIKNTQVVIFMKANRRTIMLAG